MLNILSTPAGILLIARLPCIAVAFFADENGLTTEVFLQHSGTGIETMERSLARIEYVISYTTANKRIIIIIS